MAIDRLRPAIVLLCAATGLAGCAAELPGTYFDVTVQTAADPGGNLQDTCNEPPEPFQATFSYRVVTSGGDVAIYIDEDLLATGSLDVCALSYQSATWSTKHDDGTVRWAIVGDAVVGLGSGCSAGWSGTERIQVVEASPDAGVPSGCTVLYDVEGTLDRVVE